MFHSSDEEPWLGNYVVWFRWETSFIVYQKIQQIYLENKNVYFQLVHFRLSYVVVPINIEVIYLFSTTLKTREKNIIIWFIKKALETKYSFLSQLTWHSETKKLGLLQLFLNLTVLQNHWGTLSKIETSNSQPWATESESPKVVLGIAYFKQFSMWFYVISVTLARDLPFENHHF